jgi:hypothetical protein
MGTMTTRTMNALTADDVRGLLTTAGTVKLWLELTLTNGLWIELAKDRAEKLLYHAPASARFNAFWRRPGELYIEVGCVPAVPLDDEAEESILPLARPCPSAPVRA